DDPENSAARVSSRLVAIHVTLLVLLSAATPADVVAAGAIFRVPLGLGRLARRVRDDGSRVVFPLLVPCHWWAGARLPYLRQDQRRLDRQSRAARRALRRRTFKGYRAKDRRAPPGRRLFARSPGRRRAAARGAA